MRHLQSAASLDAATQYSSNSGKAHHMKIVVLSFAEVYAQELGQEDLPDDLKYNYGEHMLKAALAAWVKGLAKAWVNSGPAGMPALSTNGCVASTCLGRLGAFESLKLILLFIICCLICYFFNSHLK